MARRRYGDPSAPFAGKLASSLPDVSSSGAERYVLAARLKPGVARAAEELLAAGPPFDPADAGFTRHAAYLGDDHVFLVFEGEAAHSKALRLANEYFVEVTRWQELVADLPSAVADVPADAQCLYVWPRERHTAP